MTARELDTLLAQLDPAADLDLPAPDSELGLRILDEAKTRGRRRSHRRILAAVAALVLIATAAAVAVVLRSETPSSQRLLCYGEADVSAPGIEGVPGETAAERACGGLWQDGPFGDDGRVPPLASCVLAGGAIGVFPGSPDVCAELELPVAVDVASLDPVRELDLSLRELVLDQGCVDFGGLEAEASRLLADSGLGASGWALDVAGTPTADRPCASYSLDTGRQRVVLVPIPDAGE